MPKASPLQAMTPERWRRVGVFGGVTLLAWMAAWVLMRQFVAGYFEVSEEATLVSRDNIVYPQAAGAAPSANKSSPTVKRMSKSEYMRDTLRRNLFDSSNVGKISTAAPSGELAATDLDVVLVATIVAKRPQHSSALIATKDGTRDQGQPSVYYINDELMGYEIVDIRGRSQASLRPGRRPGDLPELTNDNRGEAPSVILRKGPDGPEEVLWMTGDSYGKDAKPKGGAKSSGAGSVTKAGENKFIVDQALIDQITADPEKLSADARFSSHKGSDGQVDGFRMSNIRRRSLFKKLGIKNGDIVHAVNGQPLVDANQAVDAYGSLQGVTNFTFEVTRRGERQIFEYEVQ